MPLLARVVSRMGATPVRPDWAHRDATADVFRVTGPVAVRPSGIIDTFPNPVLRIRHPSGRMSVFAQLAFLSPAAWSDHGRT